jgi:glycosyltransferase involved in cell wall biosynthesis
LDEATRFGELKESDLDEFVGILTRVPQPHCFPSDDMDATAALSERMPEERLVLRAPINGYTGYGLHACQIVSDFQRMGYLVRVLPVELRESFAEIPLNVRESLIAEEHLSECELLLHAPGFPPLQGKRTAYFTMWESTRLPDYGVRALNQAECVLVPCEWNADCFRMSGVERPIRIVPLGIKKEVFPYSPMKMTGPCVFGTAGRLESGGTRKGIAQVINLFQRAFEREEHVMLKVKVFPDCDLTEPTDRRIQITRAFLSEQELASWFHEITCFVSTSRAEGWGLMQQQAMAVGRPLMSVTYGGVAAFFVNGTGYPINFSLTEAEGFYAGCGLWANPDESHVIELMRRVYVDRDEARILGERASIAVSPFTWENSNRVLAKHLEELAMLSKNFS